MARVFLHGAFAGNRGDILMHDAAVHELTKRGHDIVEQSDAADAILDCCGYWCGDAWGPWKTQEMAERCEQWKRSGKIVVLLPQTFGPFEDERLRSAAVRILRQADLACVRDRQSLDFVSSIAHQDTTLALFPDYTIDVEASPSDVFQPSSRSVAIIPNLRMIDKASEEDREAYVPFLQRCVDLLHTVDAEPFLLIHEEKDAIFAQMLDRPLHVVLEQDARKTKWIIGQSRAVVSSRYHGILNALYQNVPVLATGWCHKFDALMEECGYPDNLLDVHVSNDVLEMCLRSLLAAAPIDNSILRRLYRERNDMMWEMVGQLICSPATLAV